MGTKQIDIKIDENEADKLETVQEKKLGAEKLKRAALGELGNRVILRPTRADPLKDTKETKSNIILRNAKPRVDTHWKKPPQSSDNVGAASAAVSASNNGGTKKNPTLVRNVSTRKNEIKPTTITAQTENIASQMKYVSKSKPAMAEIKEEPVMLRREDSNLSQRSLRAIKAAIDRGTKPQPGETVPKTTTLRRGVAINASSSAPGLRSQLIQVKSVKLKVQYPDENSHSMRLLSAVDNIDADDAENPILVSEYVNPIYAYLFSLETKLDIKENYLKEQKEVIPKMRAVLIDWINEVHFQFHLVPETFQMSVGIIDRYLQSVSSTARQYLQLVGVTALFIASKYEELFPPPISDFVYITDDTYTKRQILQMEMKIVKALDFNLARPLPIHFLRRFSKAAKAEDSHHLFAKYFIELVLVEYEFASIKPSQIAAGSLNLALKLLKGSTDDSTWTPTLEYYSHYSADELRPLVRKIATIVRNAPNAKLKAVYQKFQTKKFNYVSMSPELSGSLIDAIIEGK